MGRLFKGFLALTGLLLLLLGLWWASVLILAYLVLSLLVGKGRRAVPSPQLAEGPGNPVQRAGRLRLGWRWRYLLGGGLLSASLLGLAEHGTFSPLVFAGLGSFCFLWGPLSAQGHVSLGGYTPLRESTLLRNSMMRFRWLSVVEVKLPSQESARAISVLRDDLVVVAPPSERPKAYLLVEETALGYRTAEAKASAKLARLAGLLAERGAYLMPLDGHEAARRFRPALEPVGMDLRRDTVYEAVGHCPYDVLVLKPEGSQVKAMGAYRFNAPERDGDLERLVAHGEPRTGAEAPSGTGRLNLPAARQSFLRPPLLWEAVSCLQERFCLHDADSCAVLLNSMHLSRGVPLGQKLNLASGTSGSSTVTVQSLGGAPVELTRAQLRMVVKMYG